MSQESHQSKPLLESARTRYAKAISRINAALNHPQDAIRDSTMTAVLLVGLFAETLVFKGRTLPARWTAHVEGSAALLKLRGDDQLHSPLGPVAASSTTPSQTSAPAAPRGTAFPVPSELSRICQ